MAYSEPARTSARRTRSRTIATVVVVTAALAGVTGLLLIILPGDPEPGATGSGVAQPTTGVHARPSTAEPGSPTTGDRGGPGQHDRRERQERREPTAQIGEADGALPAGVTVFDDEFPAVAKLDPGLLDALHRAAEDATDDGVEFVVNSGWRSTAYQNQLLREAIVEYGSEEEAARWVATPETSPHVQGEAVDLGPAESTPWLSEHGAGYGLCQIYENEPWHYELRPEAADDGCPPMYTDPTHDPRMRQ